MEAWQRIKARISQLFEPTLWELEVFALQDGIKRRDKALAQWEAKYWDEVKRGNQASAELEAVKAERNRFAQSEDLEIKALKSELAARPQPVKVKVRWDVTAEEVWSEYLKSGESDKTALVDWILPYLAAHAVIDAPAGVPTLEELAKIGIATAPNYWSEWASMNSLGRERMTGFASAIRDAVLGGVRAENNKVNELLSDAWQQLEELGVVPRSLADTPALQPATDWTDDQIEALARSLRDAHAKFFNEPNTNCYSLSGFMAQARAAVEFMRQTNQPVEVANAK